MYGGVIRILLDDDRVLDLEIQFLDRALVCRLLVRAASYSAFSERSPWLRASAMRCTISARLTF